MHGITDYVVDDTEEVRQKIFAAGGRPCLLYTSPSLSLIHISEPTRHGA
ncbi:hypothetical protein [Ralstonia sp. ASV6]|nr:hypothetical protein [Ralstonia sp. ASV6]